MESPGDLDGEATPADEVSLANEHHGGSRRFRRSLSVDKPGEVAEVLGHDDSVFSHCDIEHGIVRGAQQAELVDARRVVPERAQLLRQPGRHHLVDQPLHDESN